MIGPPVVTKITPQKTTGTAKFPAAKPGFKPGTTTIIGDGSPVILGPGTPANVGGLPQLNQPPAPTVSPAAQPAAVAPDGGLDATAQGAIAQNQFKTNQSITNLNQTGAYAKTDLQKALAALAQKQPLDTEKTVEGYNQQGLLYSGHLGQALGQLGQSYADRQAALQDAFTRGDASRQAQISGLGESEKLAEQSYGAQSAARRAALAASDATLGTAPASGTDALVAALAAQPAAPVSPVSEGNRVILAPSTVDPHGAVVQKIAAKGGVIHVHADGTRVFVKGGHA